MADTLLKVKDRLRGFLGKGGIHGLGISRAKGAIQVYVSPGDDADQAAVLAELKKQAAPYGVVLVEEEPPRSTSA